jgi:hypothetical protein
MSKILKVTSGVIGAVLMLVAAWYFRRHTTPAGQPPLTVLNQSNLAEFSASFDGAASKSSLQLWASNCAVIRKTTKSAVSLNPCMRRNTRLQTLHRAVIGSPGCMLIKSNSRSRFLLPVVMYEQLPALVFGSVSKVNNDDLQISPKGYPAPLRACLAILGV